MKRKIKNILKNYNTYVVIILSLLCTQFNRSITSLTSFFNRIDVIEIKLKHFEDNLTILDKSVSKYVALQRANLHLYELRLDEAYDTFIASSMPLLEKNYFKFIEIYVIYTNMSGRDASKAIMMEKVNNTYKLRIASNLKLNMDIK